MRDFAHYNEKEEIRLESPLVCHTGVPSSLLAVTDFGYSMISPFSWKRR